MKRAAWFLLGFGALGATGSAFAAPLTISCQRFQSKCMGEKCFEMGDVMAKEDMKALVARVENAEKADYFIEEKEATEQLPAANHEKDYVLHFTKVTREPNMMTLENLAPSGKPRDRVAINLTSGFYSSYSLHTDGSIKDVPIDQPYQAYFGWCEVEGAAAAPTVPPGVPNP